MAAGDVEARVVEAVLGGWVFCQSCSRLHHPSDIVNRFKTRGVRDEGVPFCTSCWKGISYGDKFDCRLCKHDPVIPPNAEGVDIDR